MNKKIFEWSLARLEQLKGLYFIHREETCSDMTFYDFCILMYNALEK